MKLSNELKTSQFQIDLCCIETQAFLSAFRTPWLRKEFSIRLLSQD
jgi:hypothetical protein